MKKTITNFLPAILIFFSLNSFAQFKAIHSDKTVFYNKKSGDETSSFLPVKIEGQKVTNGDTIYNHYRVFQINNVDWSDACRATSKGWAWTGKNIISTKDHRDVFINQSGDSIVFHKYAGINDSWTFWSSDESYFEATVIKKEPETLKIYDSQLTDSVLIISVKLKKKSDNSILDHAFNGKEWKISKKYGFVKAYDLLNFPQDTNSLILAGVDKENIGVQNLTAKEIFNFEVGDEMHIQEDRGWGGFGSSNYYLEYVKMRQTYLDKTFKNDTIIYKVEILENKSMNNSGVDSFAVKLDTVLVKVTSNELLDKIPLKTYPGDGAMYIIQVLNVEGLMGKTIMSFGYVPYNNDSDSCLTEVVTSGQPGYYHEYLKGLGGPYFEEWNGVLDRNIRKLVYYKKGTQEVGTPMNLVLGVYSNKINTAVTLSPNPSTDRIKISSEGIQNTYYKVYNNEGREVLNGNFSSTEETIDINGLRNGIYSVLILKEGGVIYTSRFVKNL